MTKSVKENNEHELDDLIKENIYKHNKLFQFFKEKVKIMKINQSK